MATQKSARVRCGWTAALAPVIVACGLADSVRAVDYSWSGGSGTWSTSATNWLWTGGSAAWPASGVDNAAIFAGTAGTATLSGGVGVNSMSFQTTGYVLGGSGTATLNGSAPTIRVDLTSAGSATIGASASGPVLAGTAGLTKAGAGTLTLSGTQAHTVTGGITVTGGTLALYLPNLPSLSNLIDPTNALTLSGGSLVMSGGSGTSTSQTFNGVTVNGGGLSTINVANPGTNTLTLGTVTQSDPGAIANFSGNGVVLSNTAPPSTTKIFVSNPAGYLGSWAFSGDPSTQNSARWAYADPVANQLRTISGVTASASGTNLNSGTTVYTVTTGTMTANAAAFGLQNTVNATVGTGSFTLTTNGLLAIGNTLTVTGTTNGRLTVGSGNVLVAAGLGNVTVNVPIVDGTAGNSNVTYVGGGTLTLSAANTYTGLTTVNSGTVSLTAANVLNSASGIVTNGGRLNLGVNNQSVASVRLAGGTIDSTTGILTLSGTGDFNLQNGTVAAILGGTSGLSKTTSGTVTLSGVNTYSGVTAVNAGLLQPSGTSALSAGTITFGGGALQYVPGSAGTDWATRFKSSSAAVALDTNGQTVTLAGEIDSSNVGGLTKLGSGTLTLSGSNAYLGATTISAGQLTVGNPSALGSAAGSVVASGGALDLGGYGVTRTGTVSFAGGTVQSGTLTNNTVAFDAQSGSVSAVLAGSAGLTKTTSGTIAISAANTYVGATISAGQFTVGNVDALGSAAGVLTASGGTLDLGGYGVTRTGTVAFAGGTVQSGTLTNNTVAFDAQSGSVSAVLAGSAGLTKTTSGTLTLSGSNTFSGNPTLSAGQLNINNATALGSGTFTISGGTIDNTSGSPITLTNNNAQAWNGNFTYAGTNNLNLGSGTVALNANRTVTTSSGTLTVGGRIMGNFTLTKAGTGTLLLSGSSSYAGATTVSAGTLVVSNSAALGGTSNGTTVTAGATLMLADGVATPAGESLTLAGSGISSFGALQVQSGTATWGGLISLSASARVGGLLGSTFRLPGTISGVGPLTIRPEDTNSGNGFSTTVVEISGAGNSYSGGTGIISGTLRLAGGADRLPTSGALAMGVASRTIYGGLDLNGNAQTVSGLTTVGDAQQQQAIITSSTAADATFTVALASGTNTFGGRFSDTGQAGGRLNVVKSGGGTLVLTGTSNNTGQTSVSGGVLTLGIANALSNQSSLLVNGGGFNLVNFSDTVGTVTLTSGSIFGSGTLTGSSYALQGGQLNSVLGTGAIAVSTGTTTLGSAGRFNPASGLTLSGGQLTLGGSESVASLVLTGGVLAGTGNTITSAATYDVQAGSVLANLGGSVGLAKSTGGLVTLSGNNTYAGGTIISGGTLALASGASLANSIQLKAGDAANDGGVLDVSALSGGLVVANSQKLGGYGTVLGDVLIGGGAIVSPGGSIGTLDVNGTQTWGPGGRYLFEVTNAGGTAGGGWDLLTVNALSITATTGFNQQFIIDIQTLANASDQTAGVMTNWDPGTSYQWQFLVADATTFTAANFDPSWFTINTSTSIFKNDTSGAFSVARGGANGGLGGDTNANSLYVVYIAVPEPGTLALAAVGTVLAGWISRLRRTAGRHLSQALQESPASLDRRPNRRH